MIYLLHSLFGLPFPPWYANPEKPTAALLDVWGPTVDVSSINSQVCRTYYEPIQFDLSRPFVTESSCCWGIKTFRRSQHSELI